MELCVCVCGGWVCVGGCESLSHVQLFAIPWTVAHQTPLCMEFPRQEYWSGLPFPSPGDLPKLGIEPDCYVSCIGRQTLYHCTTWEAHLLPDSLPNIWKIFFLHLLMASWKYPTVCDFFHLLTLLAYLSLNVPLSQFKSVAEKSSNRQNEISHTIMPVIYTDTTTPKKRISFFN